MRQNRHFLQVFRVQTGGGE